MNIMKFVRPYIVSKKCMCVLYILLKLCSSLMLIIMPYITGSYIDKLIESKDISIVFTYTKIIILICIFNLFIYIINKIISVKLSSQIRFKLICDILEHVKKLPLLYVQKYKPAYLNDRIVVSCSVIVNFLVYSLVDLIGKLLVLLLSAILLVKINYKLGWGIVFLIPIYAVCYYKFRKSLFERDHQLQETQNHFTNETYENISHIKFIKLNSLFNFFSKRLENSFTKMYISLINYTKRATFFLSLNVFINKIATVTVFLWGGIEIVNYRLSIGNFSIISVLYSNMMDSINYIFNISNEYQKALVAFNRINELLEVKEEHNGIIVLDHIQSINIKNISFSHEKRKIIDNFTYTFTKGNIYCISGPNGVGKSTLVNILIGLYNTSYVGDIFYNEQNIKDIDLYSVRKNLFGILEQCVCQQKSAANGPQKVQHRTPF